MAQVLQDQRDRSGPGGAVAAAAAPPPAADRPAAESLGGLEACAVSAVRAAALAAAAWSGRGDGKAADAAATDAMRSVLAGGPGIGTVIAGEGEKDGAPMLAPGERLGRGGEPAYDIAVDPLECTDLCASGLPGSLATIACATAGALWSPGPSFYMDKLVVGPAAREAIDLEAGPLENLRRIASALGRPVSELRVVVLDKPRHAGLVAELRGAGARVSTPPAGDVGGALAALLPGAGADVLMGVGGTPEGIMTACAVRALGGGMQARLAPQGEDERRRLLDAGHDLDRVLAVDDLVAGEAIFAAAGVTGGELVRGPWTEDGSLHTEALVVAARVTRRTVERRLGGSS